jgi:hypothetical protein
MPTTMSFEQYAELYTMVCNLFEAFHAGIFDVGEALDFHVVSPQSRDFANTVMELCEVGLTPEGEAAQAAHLQKMSDARAGEAEREAAHELTPKGHLAFADSAKVAKALAVELRAAGFAVEVESPDPPRWPVVIVGEDIPVPGVEGVFEDAVHYVFHACERYGCEYSGWVHQPEPDRLALVDDGAPTS